MASEPDPWAQASDSELRISLAAIEEEDSTIEGKWSKLKAEWSQNWSMGRRNWRYNETSTEAQYENHCSGFPTTKILQ